MEKKINSVDWSFYLFFNVTSFSVFRKKYLNKVTVEILNKCRLKFSSILYLYFQDYVTTFILNTIEFMLFLGHLEYI